jgi:hypothetical protein
MHYQDYAPNLERGWYPRKPPLDGVTFLAYLASEPKRKRRFI